jgi:hypothetical protein
VKKFGDDKQQMEVYDHARFWTITGDVWAGNREICDGQAAVDWICDEYLSGGAEEKVGTVKHEAVTYRAPLPGLSSLIDRANGFTGTSIFDPVLTELMDCLSSDGLLILEQPDLEKVVLGLRKDLSLVWWIHGDPSLRDGLHMIRWSYTQEGLCGLLRSCGYSSAEAKPPQHHGGTWRDFRVEARA